MNVLVNEDIGESITTNDFPFICRICCVKRTDLKLFEEEYLLDIFHAVCKIDARSRVEFPRNICNECINKLENISRFIDISKHNDSLFGEKTAPKDFIEFADEIENRIPRQYVEATGRYKENISVERSPACRICLSSASNLTPFQDERLVQLFQNITNIDLKGDTNPSMDNSICDKCYNELEKIWTFVSSSICNDQTLESAIDIEENVKTEDFWDPIDIKLSTCADLDLSSDRHEEPSESTSTETKFVCDGKDILEKIDIKEEIIGSGCAASREPNGNKLGSALLKKIFGEVCQKLFKCDSCNKSFSEKGNLKQHMFSHTGEKPFECELCKKRLASKSSLRKHIILHAGQKPFECDGCKKRFTAKSSLKQHMLAHTGEKPKKPFKCDVCEKSFASNSALKKHFLTHTGEKPFHCDSCLRSFGDSRSLKKHKERFHSEVSAATRHINRAKLFQKQFECEMAEKKMSPEMQLKIAYARSCWEKNNKM